MSRLPDQRGSVMVFTAIALFAMLSMMTFAIDVSHWFDYSRNLQNRADASALAAGDAFGNICFSGDPGSTQTGAQSAIGKWAQLYSGAGVGEPSVNLPYSDAQVSASPTNPVASGGPGTGWNVTADGYINNTLSASPVPSPLTLKAGLLTNYFLRLNADNYASQGGTDFAMGDFCNGDPTYDATDPQCYGQPHGQTSGPCAVGPMADVKVTQQQLPNFIPIFNVHASPSAHARVTVQQIQSEGGVRPIAVSDASYIPCVTANFLNNDGSVIASETLTQETDKTTGLPTGVWNSMNDAKSIAMPSGRQPVTVQLFLNNCVSGNPAGTKYDYFDKNGNEKPLGLVYINNWGNPASPVTAPEIAKGGVTLVNGESGTPCDPYFQTSVGNCSVDVTAQVAFPSPPAGTYYVRAVDAGGNTSCGPATSACANVDLANVTGTDWESALTAGGTGPFTFGSDSGPHNIDIWTAQLGGSVGGKACNTTGDPWATSNKNCWTELGTQQRAFSGINGSNLCSTPAFDTGPMQWITVGQADATQGGGLISSSGANAFSGSDSPHLFITTFLEGLANSQAGSPLVCLRVGEKLSHDTGLIICPPQTTGGTTQDIQAIVNGCDPLQINTRIQYPSGALTCTPTINPQDCVTNDPGSSPPILKAFDQLICTDGNNPPNNWSTGFEPGDPRALTFIITAPVDFTTQNGTTQNPTIPIRDFAIFYVTGWSTGQGGAQGCSNNQGAPPGATNGEIWGYWSSMVVPSGQGTSNGAVCKPTQFGNCIAVLTR